MILYGLVHFGDDDRRRNFALDDHLGAARVAGTVEHLAVAADHGRRSAAVEIDRIDRSQCEAGAIDGIGNRFQELWHILIPNMKSMLLFGAVMQISGAFAVGTITQELSGGYMSVQYSTLTIVNHMTDYGTVRYEMGYASAIAVVLFLLVYLSKKAVFRLLKFES